MTMLTAIPTIQPQTLFDAELVELAERNADGIEVRLLWDCAADSVIVSLVDRRTRNQCAFTVDSRRALQAFNHPFAFMPTEAAS
jgi:hypothetical protein